MKCPAVQLVFLMVGLLVAGLAGCGPSLPDHGAPQSNRAQQGVVIGVRGVAARSPTMAAVGGVAGFPMERAGVDAAVFEYTVRKPNDDLVSVTQTDRTPLALWQNVRVIAGNRARVVPDDTASAEIIAVEPQARPADAPVEEPSGPALARQP